METTDNWWRETWDEFPAGFVEDVTGGKLSGRWTPPQVVTRLSQLADQTLRALNHAKIKPVDKRDAEFRATRLDLRIHAWLAQFHAEKTMAAMHLGFFQVTGESGRLQVAWDHMRNAMSAWMRIVTATDGVYHANLVFGHAKDSRRSLGGHYHSGHWKDRLPEIEADVEYFQKLIKKHQPIGKRYKRFSAENPPLNRPQVEHDPVKFVTVGQDLAIRANVTSQRLIKLVRLHFRPLDQTVNWQHVEMKSVDGKRFEAIVPAENIKLRWDFMYYIEAINQHSGTLWPSWQDRQPYVVVQVNPAGPGGQEGR